MLTSIRCASFALGLIFVIWGPSPALALTVALSLVALVETVDRLGRVCACLAGFALGSLTWTSPRPETLPESMLVRVVSDTVEAGQPVLLAHQQGRLWWTPAQGRYCSGQRLKIRGKLAPPIAQAQHGRYGPYRHALSKSVLGRLRRVKQVQTVALPSAHQLELCLLRQGFADQIKSLVEPRLQPLALALFLGERSRKLSPVRDTMNGLGLGHLIAVSGLHVGLLLGLLLLILRLPLLLTPRYTLTGSLHHWVLLLGTTLTCWWCAWPVGGIRLWIWAAIALVAPHRPLYVTGWISLVALLVVHPEWAADLGFLLSHGISLALIHAVRRHKGWFTVPFVAAVASIPPLALVGLPSAWLGTVANLVFVPLFLPLFVLSFAGVALNAPQADLPLAFLMDLLATVAGTTGAPQLHLHLSATLAAALILATVTLLRRQFGRTFALLAVSSVQPAIEPGAQVWLLPVGHGDLALVKQGATEVVVDTGPRGDRLTDSLIPLLAGHPDLLVISHADRDHVGGAKALCTRRTPNSVWSQAPLPAPCPAPQQPRPLNLAGMRISPLASADDWLKGRNERSLVIAVEVASHRVLFLGDIGLDREMDLQGRLGQATIVKVPHHGSRTSSGTVLINETQASVALIGAAPGDRFGHPHASIVQRWQRANAIIEIADQEPRCWLLQSGRSIRRCAALDHLRRPPPKGRNLHPSLTKRRLRP